MATRNNDVTLFSNGIGHFRRHYQIPKAGQSISIPFKKEHIGDVAASLQVFGNVRLDTPPSFTPSNANATALRIGPSDAYQSLLTNLSGARVNVKLTNESTSLPSKEYILLGMETEETANAEGMAPSIKNYAVLSTLEGKIERVLFCYIANLEFTEDSVKAEISKALKNNFQQIKPESTSLDLAVSSLSEAESDATIQYTIPVAAWKMRYAIREDKGKFVLEGSAIIDNNTDENWDNFKVSVVTGNPISFNTDIATTVVPQRKFVRLVEGEALGNVDVQDAYGVQEAMLCSMSAGAAPAAPAAVGRGRMATRGFSKSSVSNYSSAGFEAAADYDSDFDVGDGPMAAAPGVDSKEVGDFCIFTSKEPITILARKSAVVPMFTITLAKAGVVLLYKESNHASRPYRSVKFKNESEYSLGKGKTVIYNEGVFSGECVLEMTKPGENRMLPHCLENGVKITKNRKNTESRRSALQLSESVGVCEDVSTAVTEYVIENKKDEKFNLAVEHSNSLGGNQNIIADFEGAKFTDKEKLANGSGYRLYFELAPKQSVIIKVMETLVNRVEAHLTPNYGYGWLKLNVIDIKNPLAKDKSVMEVIKIQKSLDEVNTEVQQLMVRKQELEQQSVRVRNNINSTKDVGNNKTISQWVTDLDEAEKEIRDIDKAQLPALNKKAKGLQQDLWAEISKLTLTWKA